MTKPSRYDLLYEKSSMVLCKYLSYYKLIAEHDLLKMPCNKDEYWRLDNNIPILYMSCINCKQYKPKLPWYYSLSNGTNFMSWLERYEVSNEKYKNYESHPCNECYRIINNNRGCININDFWRILSQGYPFTGKELKNKFNSQKFGPISGISIKYMIQQTNHLLIPGVHDMELHHKKNNLKYSKQYHTLEQCVLDFSLINIPQFNKIECLIKCYIDAYKSLHLYFKLDMKDNIEKQNQYILFFKNWYNTKPKDLGIYNSTDKNYKKVCKKYSLVQILGHMMSYHYRVDIKQNKYVQCDNKTKFLLNTFLEGGCVCSVCKIPLTIKKNKWTDMSFDRIDNTKGHFVPGNLRIVCTLHQIFNNYRYITHDMFMHMLYIQQHFRIDDDVAKKIETIHNRENCPFCEIQPI